jgi:hypothetical protein
MVRKRIVPIISMLALAAVCVAGLIPRTPARVDGDNSLGMNPIVGSWHATVSLDDGRPDVLTLYTFNRDRTFTMAGSWPGQFGSGHGTWNDNGDTAASINLTFFRLLYTPTETNEATGALGATFNGTLKVQAKLTVSDDGQIFTGRYLRTNFDANGNVRNVTPGGFKATHVAIEPLP